MLEHNLQQRNNIVFEFLKTIYNEFITDGGYTNNHLLLDWEYTAYKKFQDLLLENFPEDGLIIEDFDNRDSCNEYTWLCDPVDGTSNMMTGVSFFSMAFSLVINCTKPVLSFVVDMINGHIYIAYLDTNTCYHCASHSFIPIQIKSNMQPDEYILIGKVFGHIDPIFAQDLQAPWWNLAMHSKSYRQLGSIALQMIIDGLKRNIIVFSLKIRWFDIVGSLHFLFNLGYDYKVSSHKECLLVFKKDMKHSLYLEQLILGVENKWDFLPLNTIDISR